MPDRLSARAPTAAPTAWLSPAASWQFRDARLQQRKCARPNVLRAVAALHADMQRPRALLPVRRAVSGALLIIRVLADARNGFGSLGERRVGAGHPRVDDQFDFQRLRTPSAAVNRAHATTA